MTGHLTAPVAALADELPAWVTLVRAPNPGPMTLDGTNTWVLRAPGAAGAVVVDPGPLDAGHLAAVAGHVPISLILLTHGHPDHVDGAAELAARTGADVLGPIARSVAGSPAGFRALSNVAAPLGAGERPGGAPLAGGEILVFGDLELAVIATPGHTADSACLLADHRGEQAIFTGDTILGRGTTVVAHPDGDLGDYLDSLDLLTAYDGVPALPGHGPALADCGTAARFYLAHRRARLEQVRQAVAQGAVTAADVVASVYADVDRSLWPAAEWSVRAQLAYLRERESLPGIVGLDTP